MTKSKQPMSPTTFQIVEMPKGKVTMSMPKGDGVQQEGEDPDAGYTGPVISMFGHMKGLGNENQMQDLNVAHLLVLGLVVKSRNQKTTARGSNLSGF